jgi:hypothetical protein
MNRGLNFIQNKFFTNTQYWGSFILEREEVLSDGNALGYNISRDGIVVGADKKLWLRKSHSYHTLGLMFAFNEADLDTYRAAATAQDFNVGIYHNTRFRQNRWEWKNYLGMGLQDYTMEREMALALGDSCMFGHIPSGPLHPSHDNTEVSGLLSSRFRGYTMSANTEFARPVYFGRCNRWMIRPFVALDLMAVWQNATSESGDLVDITGINQSHIVTLDYFAATDVRLYGRPGFSVRREGPRGYLRGGLSYSFLMGGRPYTNVDNRFQYGGDDIDKFNIRGVRDAEFLNGNWGGGIYFGKDRRGTAWVDYLSSAGTRTTTHALQVGTQVRF